MLWKIRAKVNSALAHTKYWLVDNILIKSERKSERKSAKKVKTKMESENKNGRIKKFI